MIHTSQKLRLSTDQSQHSEKHMPTSPADRLQVPQAQHVVTPLHIHTDNQSLNDVDERLPTCAPSIQTYTRLPNVHTDIRRLNDFSAPTQAFTANVVNNPSVPILTSSALESVSYFESAGVSRIRFSNSRVAVVNSESESESAGTVKKAVP
jgi:hypothetical protein